MPAVRVAKGKKSDFFFLVKSNFKGLCHLTTVLIANHDDKDSGELTQEMFLLFVSALSQRDIKFLPFH